MMTLDLDPGHLAQILLTYTLPQKKDNFRKVVCLLGKSVNCHGICLGDKTGKDALNKVQKSKERGRLPQYLTHLPHDDHYCEGFVTILYDSVFLATPVIQNA